MCLGRSGGIEGCWREMSSYGSVAGFDYTPSRHSLHGTLFPNEKELDSLQRIMLLLMSVSPLRLLGDVRRG